jgi:hypothetical protein
MSMLVRDIHQRYTATREPDETVPHYNGDALPRTVPQYAGKAAP